MGRARHIVRIARPHCQLGEAADASYQKPSKLARQRQIADGFAAVILLGNCAADPTYPQGRALLAPPGAAPVGQRIKQVAGRNRLSCLNKCHQNMGFRCRWRNPYGLCGGVARGLRPQGPAAMAVAFAPHPCRKSANGGSVRGRAAQNVAGDGMPSDAAEPDFRSDPLAWAVAYAVPMTPG